MCIDLISISSLCLYHISRSISITSISVSMSRSISISIISISISIYVYVYQYTWVYMYTRVHHGGLFLLPRAEGVDFYKTFKGAPFCYATSRLLVHVLEPLFVFRGNFNAARPVATAVAKRGGAGTREQGGGRGERGRKGEGAAGGEGGGEGGVEVSADCSGHQLFQ